MFGLRKWFRKQTRATGQQLEQAIKTVCEMLESRTHLSTQLHIEGTIGNDSISAYLSNSTTLTIDLNGTTTNYNLADIESIWLWGCEGDDTLTVASSITTPAFLYGQDGNDFLSGGSGNDVLWGINGDDTLRGGGGADELNGGTGYNTLDYTTSPSGVNISLDGVVNDTDGFGYTDTIQGSVTVVYGSSYNDYLAAGNDASLAPCLVGYSGNDTLIGGPGADMLVGFEGNDSLVGNGGNDFLSGDAGTDTIIGGAGQDMADYAGAPAGISLNMLNNSCSDGYGTTDVIQEVETVNGTPYSDTLIGDNNGNMLCGNGGADTLCGNGGADSLYGGDGGDFVTYSSSYSGVSISLDDVVNDADGFGYIDYIGPDIEHIIGSDYADTLIGNSSINSIYGLNGNDTIYGRAGDDSLNGGDGNDLVYGEDGEDLFVANDWSIDSLFGGAGADYAIMDSFDIWQQD